MGNFCCRKRKYNRKIALLLLGLDNAGKTVAVKQLAGQDTVGVVPTVGFSIVDLKYSNYDVRVYDLGGRSDFRDVWERYYVDAYGVIFVIDSSDFNRLEEAQTVLHNLLNHDKVKGKPILILANKQDNENAMDEIDLIEKLDLEALANENECPTLVQSCCASSTKKLDYGIKMGYNWIVNCIIRNYDKLNDRVDNDIEYQEKLDEEERREKLLRIKYLSEQDALRDKELMREQLNGNIEPSNDKKLFEEVTELAQAMSDSSSNSTKSSELEEPIVYLGNVPGSLIESTRPKSATNLIRRQLQLDNLESRSPPRFHRNKTAPVQLFGTKPKAPKSATVRSSSSKNSKINDRRNLRSAGDSVFVVSDGSLKVMPIQDGSGDLNMSRVNFKSKNTPHRLSNVKNVLKDVLPPVNDIPIPLSTLQNGTSYF